VTISVTSLDAGLSRRLEPRAAAPAKRLAALGRLAAAGIPAHVNVAPIIPAITDEFIERILAEAARVGVGSAGWILLRLPHEVAPLFRAWLAEHFPDRADKVMNIVHAMRGGRDNDPRFFSRMRPEGVWPDLIRARFNKTAARFGLARGFPELDVSGFMPPGRDGQLRLL